MILDCDECGKSMSSVAGHCPHCGNEPEGRKKFNKLTEECFSKMLETEETPEKSGLELLFICIWATMLIPFSIVIRAWTITVLWGWSLVPIGVPQISLVCAAMLGTLISFVMCTGDLLKKGAETMLKEKSTLYITSYAFGKAILLPPFIVGTAWVIKWVMTAFFGA